MKGQYRLIRSTCHALYDVEMAVDITAAGAFSLTVEQPPHIQDWERYLAAMAAGIQEALIVVGKSTDVNVVVVLTDYSRQTPPYGYNVCAKEAVAKALEIPQ